MVRPVGFQNTLPTYNSIGAPLGLTASSDGSCRPSRPNQLAQRIGLTTPSLVILPVASTRNTPAPLELEDELELLELEELLEELDELELLLELPDELPIHSGTTKLLPEEWLSWKPKLADSPAPNVLPVAVTVVPLWLTAAFQEFVTVSD